MVNNLQKVYRDTIIKGLDVITSKNYIIDDNRYGSYNTIIYSAETAQIKQ